MEQGITEESKSQRFVERFRKVYKNKAKLLDASQRFHIIKIGDYNFSKIVCFTQNLFLYYGFCHIR